MLELLLLGICCLINFIFKVNWCVWWSSSGSHVKLLTDFHRPISQLPGRCIDLSLVPFYSFFERVTHEKNRKIVRKWVWKKISITNLLIIKHQKNPHGLLKKSTLKAHTEDKLRGTYPDPILYYTFLCDPLGFFVPRKRETHNVFIFCLPRGGESARV